MRTTSQTTIFAKLLALALGSIAETASAAGQSYTDYARVLDVEPIKEVAAVPVSRRRCDYPSRAQRADAAFAGDVRSNHPGVSLGEAIGAEIRHRENAQAMRRCRLITVYENTDRIVAYRVRYAYGDGVFTRRMSEYPQARLPVRINLEPFAP